MRLKVILGGAMGMFLFGLMWLSVQPVSAAGVVGDGTPGSCTAAAYALAIADGGSVTFNCGPDPLTIVVDTAVITAATTVDGGGLISLSGDNLRQIFYVQYGTALTVMNLSLINANAANGGAIYNQGTVTLQHTIVFSNGTSSDGGGIQNLGTLTINRSRLENNSAAATGGGIYNNGGDVTVVDTIFINNNGAQSGGGIAQNGGSTTVRGTLFEGNVAGVNGGGTQDLSDRMSFTNVTFAGNYANQGGGIDISSGATITLTNVTMDINHADVGGGIYSSLGSSIRLKGTIVSRSLVRAGLDPSLNCDNGGTAVASFGYNLATDNSCNLTAGGDQPGVSDPKLGALADYGGPTLSIMPLAGSPVIDQIPLAACTVATDQRGAPRPFGTACDVGAVEYGALVPRLYLPLVVR